MARSAQGLERHPLALGLAVLAVTAVLTWISIVAINGVPFSGGYEVQAVVPADAPLLKDGDDVRIGGQRAGQVRAVDVAGDASGARLKLELEHGPIGRDARAAVRLRGLAGSTYVELFPGDARNPLPEGASIPLSATRAGVELSDVVAGFGADTRRAMARTLETYGAGLLGRGQDVNAALGDLAPALADSTPLLRAMRPEPGDLAAALSAFDGTARAFARPGTRELEALLEPAAAVMTVLAERRSALRTTIAELRPLEDEALTTLPVAEPMLVDVESAARALTPAVRELESALPDLRGLLAERRALAELPRLARAADPVLGEAEPLVGELRPVAGFLRPLANPVEAIAGYMAPYKREIFLAPDGFTRWGRFQYNVGEAPGHRAVRFAPVFTCHRARDAYPAPGEALDQSQGCSG